MADLRMGDIGRYIGRGVIYRPYPDAAPEEGEITGFSKSYVFVRFRDSRAPKGVAAELLTLV